nr:hypothetical protein [Tanacetum cinerariifolium]
MPRTKFNVLSRHLQEIMKESLPKMVDDRVKELTKIQVPVYVAHRLIMERQQSQADVAKMIADVILQERENLRAEISSQINNAITNHIPSQVDSSVRNYMSGHILHVHLTQATPAPTQEQQYQLYLTMHANPQLQQDDLPIWLVLKYKFERLYVSNTSCRPSSVHPRDQDDPYDDAYPGGENDAKKQKTSMHRTYVSRESSSDQVNESESDPSNVMPTLVVQSCQRDPKALALSLVNQDLLYLKKGSSGPEKIVMSLHKFPEVIFFDDDIEERTSKWIIKTYWELGHKHKFITEIIARRANGSIVSITDSDYKNLNKNDIEDMYLLIVNDKALRSTRCFIISEPVHGIIYKNSKKQKRVIRHQEIHKLCDAILKRVLEGFKIYNNNVKHGYLTPSLSKEDVEYLQMYEEEIEEWLKHQDQMRRWEMYMNERPLGSRKERPE